MAFFSLFCDLVNNTMTEVEDKYGRGWTAVAMFFLLVGLRTICLVVLAGVSLVAERLGLA